MTLRSHDGLVVRSNVSMNVVDGLFTGQACRLGFEGSILLLGMRSVLAARPSQVIDKLTVPP